MYSVSFSIANNIGISYYFKKLVFIANNRRYRNRFSFVRTMKFDLSVTHRKPSGDCLLYLLYIVVLCMNHQLFVVNTSRVWPNCRIVWTLSFKYLFGCHTYVFFGTVSFRRLNFVIIITTNISDVEDLLSYTNSDVMSFKSEVRSTETIGYGFH